jgi:hypothetical protein
VSAPDESPATFAPPTSDVTSLAFVLRRRGFELRPSAGEAKLLLPQPPELREQLYRSLLHYSFRLLLRDVLVHRSAFNERDLEKYCSPATVTRYLGMLETAGLVARGCDGALRLAKDTVDSFGDTLEWLTAEILRRDFGMETVHGVRLEGAPDGGDYDVLATAEGGLLYVETKSAPPRHVHNREIASFFDRLEALRPDAAVFVEDTRLRMTDKLLVMFEEELERRFGGSRPRMERLTDETFVLEGKLFLANASPDLATSLGRCVVHYFRSRPYCLDGARIKD